MLSPAAVGLMLVRRSKSQPARNRICAIPVETAQLCKAANRAATYLLFKCGRGASCEAVKSS
jgi:hypothetical protein